MRTSRARLFRWLILSLKLAIISNDSQNICLLYRYIYKKSNAPGYIYNILFPHFGVQFVIAKFCVSVFLGAVKRVYIVCVSPRNNERGIRISAYAACWTVLSASALARCISMIYLWAFIFMAKTRRRGERERYSYILYSFDASERERESIERGLRHFTSCRADDTRCWWSNARYKRV